MPVEGVGAITAYIAVVTVGMHMPQLAMLTVDTLVFIVAAKALTNLQVRCAALRGLQVAQVIGIAVVTGEAVLGIRPMSIPGSVILVWDMSIQITEFTVTLDITMVRTAMDIGRT